MISSFIPDTPGSVKTQIQRENLLQRENLFAKQKQEIKEEKNEGEEVRTVYRSHWQ